MKTMEEIAKAERELLDAGIEIALKHNLKTDEIYIMYAGACSKVFATSVKFMTDKVKDKHAMIDGMLEAFREDVHSCVDEIEDVKL